METYVSFLAYIGRHVVRDKHFKSLTHNTSPRDVNDWFTPQDEAIAITIFENGRERWKADFNLRMEECGSNPAFVTKSKLPKNKIHQLPPQKYTETRKNGRNEPSGWGHMGMKRYCELVQKCKDFHNIEKFVDFSKYTIDCLSKRNSLRTTKRKCIDLNMESEAKKKDK